MRIRMPFAGIFAALLLLSAYAGLSSLHMPQGTLLNDKTLHFFVFFLLTVSFYWILDTTRRRVLHLTLSAVTLGMGVGSEFVQAAIPNNGRNFDPYDILANLVGSLMGLGLCAWYHKRMLERRRVRKYTAVPTGEEDIPEGDADLELGEGIGGGVVRRSGEHEEGVVVAAAASVPAAASPAAAAATATAKNMSLEEELDNWDENAVDAWDDGDEGGDVGGSGFDGKSGDATKDVGAAKKRVD